MNRKRSDFSSANQVAFTNPKWYYRFDPYFKYLYETDISLFGKLQKYTQYLLLNEMRSLQDRGIPKEFMNFGSKNNPLESLKLILPYIESNQIMEAPLSFWHRVYLLKLKSGSNVDIKLYKYSYYFNIDGVFVEKINPVIRFSFIEERKKIISIIGYYNITSSLGIELICVFGDKVYTACQKCNDNYGYYFFGNRIHESICFEFNIPCANMALKTENELKFYIRVSGIGLFPVRLIFERKCSLRNRPYSFTSGENTIISLTERENVLSIKAISYEMLRLCAERYIKTFDLRKYSYQIGVFREYIDLYPKLKRNRVWLFFDRPDSADDNAEHLFKYASPLSDNIQKYFVIKKETNDYKRLERYGKVIAFGSREHLLLFLCAEKLITSQTVEGGALPYNFYDSEIRDLFSCLLGWDIMYLQHGLIKDNLSGWLNRLQQNIKLFVSASPHEYKSLIGDDYFMSEHIVKELGFPRFDSLISREKRRIVYMPTWRKSLSLGIDVYNENFKSPLLCQGINSLMSNAELIEFAVANGYEIVFRPHPRMYIQANDFCFNDVVKLSPITESYQTLFETGSLLITDYSSAMFDFAYLKKPVLYYQYCEPNLEKGYWNDYEMGFGEIVNKQDDLIVLLKEYIADGCKMRPKYCKRVNDYFSFTDRNNCKRVYESILKYGSV